MRNPEKPVRRCIWKTAMKVGLLNCLLYYPLGPYWETFFRELKFEVVVSPALSRDDFDRKRTRFAGDICLPVESVAGHLDWMKGRVDFAFMPKLLDRRGDLYICPVCAGLPSVIRHVFADGPEVRSFPLTPFSEPGREAKRSLLPLGRSPGDIRRAHVVARDRYAALEAEWRADLPGRNPGTAGVPPRTILVLGMPYVLGDPLTNGNLHDLLRQRGCEVAMPLNLVPRSMIRRVHVAGYPIYWSFAGMSIHAMEVALKEWHPDGVIYLSSFACGVDSVVVPIVQAVCRRCEDLPCLTVTVDEHASAAHVEVRVEAFLDCVDAGIRKKARA